MLKGKIEQKLIDWKNTPDNKPLIIRGCRQCGKTYSALDFAAKKTRCYSPVLYHLAYLFSYFTLFITCRACMITTAIMTA